MTHPLVGSAALVLLAVLILAGCERVPSRSAGLTAPKRFRVVGPSMEPTLLPGDWFLAEPVDFDALRVGDIILFRHGDRNVVHRIAEVRGRKLWTKGDNNSMRDRFWVYPEDVVGRVVAPYPVMRRRDRAAANLRCARCHFTLAAAQTHNGFRQIAIALLTIFHLR